MGLGLMVRRPRLKRGWDRGHVFVPAVKVRLGQVVLHRHVFYLAGVEYVNHERSTVVALHRSSMVTVQTVYGYLRTVSVDTLYI